MRLLAWPFRVIDQRFEPRLEAMYFQSQQFHFIKPGCIAASISIIGVVMHAQEVTDAKINDSLQTFILHWLILDIALVMSWLILLCLWKLGILIRFLNLEAFTLFICYYGIVSLSVSNNWHGAVLLGKDPFKEFGPHVVREEAQLVHNTLMVTLFVCVATPMRSHMSLMIPACGLACFSIASAVASSPHPGNQPNTFLTLIGSLGFIWYGGFVQEGYVRECWSSCRQRDRGACLLINRMCYCVFRIGRSFDIQCYTSNFPELLGFDGNQRVQGLCFLDFLSTDEDRSRFTAAMASSSSNDESVGLLHLHFSTAGVEEIATWTYCAKDTHGESSGYLIGISATASEPPEQEVALHVPGPSQSSSRRRISGSHTPPSTLSAPAFSDLANSMSWKSTTCQSSTLDSVESIVSGPWLAEHAEQLDALWQPSPMGSTSI